MAVRAEGEDNGDILVPAAGGGKLVQNCGENVPTRHRPGNIARDNGNFLAGLCKLPQTRRADGMLQRTANSISAKMLVRHGVCKQHVHDVFVRKRDGLRSGSVSKFQLHITPQISERHAAAP